LSEIAVPSQPDVSFALVGAGSVGGGVFHQSLITPGVRCDVVCDLSVERALSLHDPNRPSTVVDTPRALADALRRGEVAVCQDAMLAATAANVDVLFDASTAIDTAPAFIDAAMAAGKHVVMMNAEADLLFGPLFWEAAQRHGVAYTSCDGDQPAAIARLAEELAFYGLELAMAGNIKGYLDRYTDPVAIRPEAEKRYLDPQMCASYTDGTKLCVEMALVANGLGGRVARPGMLGPRMAEATDMFGHFAFDRIWSPGAPPLVDYVLGAKPRGGVFVVGHTDDAYQRKMLDWFPPDIGPGPFYLLTRPYHLVHLETMRTVLEVAGTKRSLLAPRFGLRTEVVCHAKTPLAPGDRLDGPGGFSCYGLIENRGEAGEPGFPICLSHDARLARAVARDERIAWTDVDEASIGPAALAAYRRTLSLAARPARA
jgi:predicted homoserine dehydrogenase-like protein